MILIVTERADLTADWLVVELERRGAAFCRFNTEDYPTRVGIEWRVGGSVLTFENFSLALADAESVWYRRPVPPTLPDNGDRQAAEWAIGEANAALLGVWRSHDARWVNHPDKNKLAEAKQEQLQRASKVGLSIPDSVVTNRPDVVREFLGRRAAICKPIWSGRIGRGVSERLFFTSLVDLSAAQLELMGPEPYFFQELVPKEYDVRVTVIGDQVFAARIDSQDSQDAKIDWRRSRPGALAHSVEDLPPALAQSCLDLCRSYGLQFGAIDLARRPDGGYTFFEINPNGQWAWVEQRTGLPLRAALADLLIREHE